LSEETKTGGNQDYIVLNIDIWHLICFIQYPLDPLIAVQVAARLSIAASIFTTVCLVTANQLIPLVEIRVVLIASMESGFPAAKPVKSCPNAYPFKSD
jgi:hypothetical protein